MWTGVTNEACGDRESRGGTRGRCGWIVDEELLDPGGGSFCYNTIILPHNVRSVQLHPGPGVAFLSSEHGAHMGVRGRKGRLQGSDWS